VALYIKDPITDKAVTYNANGGTSAPEAQTGEVGSNITISGAVPTRTDYTFLGWSEDNTATTATYTAGQVVTMPANGLTLYAVWGDKYISNAIDTNGVKYYIPQGFTYVEGVVETGLVIQDGDGNQFVWIPVAYQEIEYSKIDYEFPLSERIDDTLPDGIASEETQIDKYGGFYIARFEAGLPDSLSTAKREERNVYGVPTSINQTLLMIWCNIDYTHAKANAESMYSNFYIQSGLVTGTQWDVVMKWIGGESRMSYNPQTASEPDIKHNIYNLAGNKWEMINEIRTGFFVVVVMA
jgi:uncharacterized repeat protein (TIGR02543 family)